MKLQDFNFSLKTKQEDITSEYGNAFTIEQDNIELPSIKIGDEVSITIDNITHTGTVTSDSRKRFISGHMEEILDSIDKIVPKDELEDCRTIDFSFESMNYILNLDYLVHKGQNVFWRLSLFMNGEYHKHIQDSL